MGQTQRRKANLAKNKQYQKVRKTKHKTKDMDEILEDLKPENLIKIQNKKLDENLPGLGQYPCVACSRYFIDKSHLETHYKGKEHKKRLKRLKEEKENPYTIADSKKYAGLN
jgi:bud site selection protein 20